MNRDEKILILLTAALAVMMALSAAVQVTGSDADTASEPPLITMSPGDSFRYIADTNLDSEISASGDVLSDNSHQNGTFLTWDPETDTLSGTATAVGDYIVVLTAVWTSEDGVLQQTSTQTVEFEIVDSDGSTGLTTLTYDSAADVYTLEFVTSADTADITDGTQSSGTDLAQYWWIVLIVIFVVGFFVYII